MRGDALRELLGVEDNLLGHFPGVGHAELSQLAGDGASVLGEQEPRALVISISPSVCAALSLCSPPALLR